MSNTNQDPIDLETLTDAEFLNLSEDQINSLSTPEEEEETEEETNSEEQDTETELEDNEEVNNDETKSEEEDKPQSDEEDESTSELEEETENKEAPKQKDEVVAKQEKEKPEPVKKEEVVISPEKTFFDKVTASFKADGKDFQVKTPEDAIRLMQQGVNYSRRMQEIKPIKALNTMLSKHGLADADKLSHLIDVFNGKPEAIQKLLKDRNIDPLDLSTEEATEYKTPNYSESETDTNFREALEHVSNMPGGTDVLKDVNTTWDNESKEALRTSPAIFDSLMEHKESGAYDLITKELDYQKTLGHLNNVPFLKAYHQVGAALDKAGVFNKEEVQKPISEESKEKLAPLDTGPRKASLKKKSEKPNQDISSLSQPTADKPSNDDNSANETDYSTLSDEEFLKLNSPS